MDGGVDKLSVLEGLFDKKRIAILRVFLGEPDRKFYLRELAKLAGVPPATTLRIIGLLTRLKLIEMQKVAKFKVYHLRGSDSTKFLEAFLKEEPLIMDLFVKHVGDLAGVERIILHGKMEGDKANILIIGSQVDQGAVKTICADIREKYNFKISSLTLDSEQFEQMSRMGLYSGVKKTLYRAK